MMPARLVSWLDVEKPRPGWVWRLALERLARRLGAVGCARCGTEDVGRFDPDRSLTVCGDCLDDAEPEPPEPQVEDLADAAYDRDR